MIISLAQFEVQNLGLVFLLFFCSQLTQKLLPGGELNPGLPRDRRGYLPLYYRGTKALNSLFMKFWRPITNTAHQRLQTQNDLNILLQQWHSLRNRPNHWYQYRFLEKIGPQKVASYLSDSYAYSINVGHLQTPVIYLSLYYQFNCCNSI